MKSLRIYNTHESVTTATNTANVWSTVLTFTAPRSTAFRLRDDAPVRIYVPAKESFTGVDASGATVTITTTTPIVENDTINFKALATIDGTPAPVVSVTPPNTIVIDSSGSSNVSANVDVWFIPANGLVRFVVETPGGAAMISKVIFSSQIITLHERNQYSFEEAVFLPRAYLVPENWKFHVQVKASWTADMAANIAVLDLPVMMYTPSDAVYPSLKHEALELIKL